VKIVKSTHTGEIVAITGEIGAESQRRDRRAEEEEIVTSPEKDAGKSAPEEEEVVSAREGENFSGV
jgi:hypothetical protein